MFSNDKKFCASASANNMIQFIMRFSITVELVYSELGFNENSDLVREARILG